MGELVSEGDGCNSLRRASLQGLRRGYRLDMGVSVEVGSRDGLEGRAVADEAEAGGEPRPPMGAALAFRASASVLLRVLRIPTDFRPVWPPTANLVVAVGDRVQSQRAGWSQPSTMDPSRRRRFTLSQVPGL